MKTLRVSPPLKMRERAGLRRGERPRGFTLLELMLVIAIISILTAIAFISMLHYELVINVNASARDLAGTMRAVRSYAVRDGQTYQMTFATNAYAFGGTCSGCSSMTRQLQPGIVFGYLRGTVAVPGHPYPTCAIYIGGSCGTQFYFYRDGTFSADGVAYLIPSRDMGGTGARDDRQRAVDWSATSGRVRLWKYYASNHTWR
jgi:prepilin-type N-terminal cleavage/methylation domain-containing protein